MRVFLRNQIPRRRVLIAMLALGFIPLARAGTEEKKIQVEIVQMTPVTCTKSSLAFDLQTQVKNLSNSIVRLGKVDTGRSYRVYLQDSEAKLKLLRTESFEVHGPPFNIITGQYEVPDDPLMPNEVRTYSERTGFPVTSEDIQTDGENRKITVSVYVTNTLPKGQPFGSYAWGLWTKPITIWVPKECRLGIETEKRP